MKITNYHTVQNLTVVKIATTKRNCAEKMKHLEVDYSPFTYAKKAYNIKEQTI